MASAETVSVPSADAAVALRTLMAGYLTGPTIRNVLLDARLPSQALAEARSRDCAYLLTMTLTQKRGGGGNKFFGRVLNDSGTAAAAPEQRSRRRPKTARTC
jgi:hypothetical protein